MRYKCKKMLSKFFRRNEEPKKLNLEELLEKLPSDEREFVEIGAVREGFSKSPDYAVKASDFYADKESGYDLRAKFEILKGNPEGAITIYTEEYPFIEDAAKVAKTHISIERAIQVYEKAIEKEDLARYHEGLARLHQEKGDASNAEEQFRKAIAGYEQEGHFGKIEELERERGNLENVINLYVKLAELNENSNNRTAFYYSALNVAEEIGDNEKVNQLNEKILDSVLEGNNMFFNSENLITLAQKVGNKDKLIKAYMIAGEIQEAFKLAIQEENQNVLLNIVSKTRSIDKLTDMAEIAIINGRTNMAIEIYERAGKYKTAAIAANQYGNPQKALDICTTKIDSPNKNGDFKDADYYHIAMNACAKLYTDGLLRMTIGKKAIYRFAALGQFDVAAKFAEKLGETEKANTYNLLAALPKA